MPATTLAPAHIGAFIKEIQNPLKLRLFLLGRLPAAFFAGLRIDAVSENSCAVSVRYRWATKNPFRSIYFACLSMAAELSTGVLAMARVQGHKPAVSMLVTGMEAHFHKKATGKVTFTCHDGAAIADAAAAAMETGAAQTARVLAEGKNEKDEPIATFWFEWSFKQKSSKSV